MIDVDYVNSCKQTFASSFQVKGGMNDDDSEEEKEESKQHIYQAPQISNQSRLVCNFFEDDAVLEVNTEKPE